MGDLVTIEIEGGVADVRLNRPEKYNALSSEMFEAIGAAGDQLTGEPGLRSVVLSGNGPGFCSGLDISTFGGGGGGVSMASTGGPDNHAQHCAYVWKQLPVPVLAAIHGVAYGAGFQIAMGADIRFARPDARLSIMEIKWGLVPDVAITQTVRDVLRLDVAKDLVFTGRVVAGEEALALGVVTFLDEDPLAAALAKAREIAGKSPDAIRADKRLLETAWHAEPAEGLALEATEQKGLMGSPNQREAVKANMENRAPEFEDASSD